MTAPRTPVLFVGHGSPMNAVEDNAWSRGWRALAATLPRPSAILAISAHWFVDGSAVTVEAAPRTIHDFGGFPPELYTVRYPAPGAPELAARVAELLHPHPVEPTERWGLDHGTWSVLVHMWPAADVPVVQLSMSTRLAPAEHLDLGRALAPLRAEGVLVLASGNVVHNLRDAFDRMRTGDRTTPDWAETFDARVERALVEHDRAALLHALDDDLGRAAHPTPEHWLPLLYAVGAAGEEAAVRFPVTGFDLGSLSMRAVRLD